jgi:hypothetical protein
MSKTRSLTVNFFHVVPSGESEVDFERLLQCFSTLDPTTLTDKHKKLDYELCSHVVERRDGFVTGALSNGQSGGILPYRHDQAGNMLPVLGPGEKLVHPTCFFYDTQRSILLLESITKGATESDWCLYFNNNIPNCPNISGKVVRRGELEDVVTNLRYITQFHVEVAGYRREDLFSALAKTRSVKEFTALAESSGSNTVNCTLRTDVKPKSKNKGRQNQESLEPGFIRGAIDAFLGEPEVRTLKLSGINENDDYIPLINLLEFRLRDTIDVDISELSMANLNLKKRVERLRMLHASHLPNLIGYEKP